MNNFLFATGFITCQQPTLWEWGQTLTCDTSLMISWTPLLIFLSFSNFSENLALTPMLQVAADKAAIQRVKVPFNIKIEV